MLNLDNCIELAIENNPNISAAKNNAKIFESRIGQAKSNYYPQLNLSTGYDRRNSATESSIDNSFNQMQANITLSQNIFDFGKTSSNVKIQDYNFKSSESELENTVIQIVFNVKKAYYTALTAIKNKEVYDAKQLNSTNKFINNQKLFMMKV
ncbi:MAG: TolC family protein [Desulfosudis oleivorans]|nr:TolC family protein [Desulfosudis oleivorans]